MKNALRKFKGQEIAKYDDIRQILSQSDFTGGCGFSPHRLLGLLDLSAKRHHHRSGNSPCPKNFVFCDTTLYYDVCQRFLTILLKIFHLLEIFNLIPYARDYMFHSKTLLLI